MQSVPITTKVVSSNPAHGEVYSIQHVCDKVCQWLEIGRWFSPGTPVSSTNKTDRYDITELLLKVALTTIKKKAKKKKNKKNNHVPEVKQNIDNFNTEQTFRTTYLENRKNGFKILQLLK